MRSHSRTSPTLVRTEELRLDYEPNYGAHFGNVHALTFIAGESGELRLAWTEDGERVEGEPVIIVGRYLSGVDNNDIKTFARRMRDLLNIFLGEENSFKIPNWDIS